MQLRERQKKMGEGCGRGMLTDSEGWRAGANDYGQSLHHGPR